MTNLTRIGMKHTKQKSNSIRHLKFFVSSSQTPWRGTALQGGEGRSKKAKQTFTTKAQWLGGKNILRRTKRKQLLLLRKTLYK
jgi:hypothetical protein